MSRRHLIRMTEEEIRSFLQEHKTIILTSNGPDGFPHPMPMWFALEEDGAIHMTTFRKSQKIRNIHRDPRVSLLVESGLEYAELKGVVLYARAELIDDRDRVVETLLRASGTDTSALDEEAAAQVRAGMMRTAAKRVLVRCKPERIVSWDHAKLGGRY
jgi:PPOX class probable F420-dependent enzyme